MEYMGESSYLREGMTEETSVQIEEIYRKRPQENVLDDCMHKKIENLDRMGSFLGKYNISKLISADRPVSTEDTEETTPQTVSSTR